METLNQLKAHNAKYQWHPMGPPKALEAQAPHIISQGNGVYIYDIDGYPMIDGTAGLWNVNVGHNRPEIKAAIIKQLDELAYYSGFHGTSNPRSIELSHKLIAMSAPEAMGKVLFLVVVQMPLKLRLK
ncbi:MAG: aminotransferase class III-fold pyridoxal phosphate-dependent enzyme [Deinococcales bacterium]